MKLGKQHRLPNREDTRDNMMYNFVRARRSNESSRPSLLSDQSTSRGQSVKFAGEMKIRKVYALYKDRLMKLSKTINKILIRKNRMTEYRLLMLVSRKSIDMVALASMMSYKYRYEVVQAFKNLQVSRRTGETAPVTTSMPGSQMQDAVNI